MRHFTIARALVALCILSAPVAAQSASASPTTVIVVRHAEKAAEPASDPILSPAGTARGEALLDLVRDAGVQAVFNTPYQRTRLTSAPVAAKFGLTPEVLDARAPAKAVADSILARHRGQTVLVVGHSNTVPDIVAALGAPKPAMICDDGYDNVFVVTVPATGAASVVRLHYGVKASCP